MKESSSLVPQGSLLGQKHQGRAKFKLAVFCVIGIHIAGLMALLLTQGCKREPVPTPQDVQSLFGADTNLPAVDDLTNVVTSLPDTNLYALPNTAVADPGAPAAAVTEHVIVRGDTFFDLARKYGVTMQALRDANPTVNANNLQIGTKITIPAPAPAPATAVNGGTAPVTTAGETTHKVVSGDNLTRIAAKYGVTVNALRSANNLTSDRIVVGQVLKIPAKSPNP
jgi:LysM repeat protein